MSSQICVHNVYRTCLHLLTIMSVIAEQNVFGTTTRVIQSATLLSAARTWLLRTTMERLEVSHRAVSLTARVYKPRGPLLNLEVIQDLTVVLFEIDLTACCCGLALE